MRSWLMILKVTADLWEWYKSVQCRGTAIFFAVATLRSVPQAGSQFRGRSKLFMKYPG